MFIICGGLMRTGSIAMWQIMDEIAKTQDKPSPMLGTNLNDVIKIWRKERYNDNPLLVTKLHFYEDALMRYDPKIKVVATIRDLRDVLVSLMHFKGTDFNGEIGSRAFTTWVTNYNSWYEHIIPSRIMEVKYEEFVANRTDTILAVADFMGVTLSKESAGHIDNKWSIASNLRRSNESHDAKSKEFMSKRHIYSKGKSKWREEFTDEQVTIIMTGDRLEWMENHGYI